MGTLLELGCGGGSTASRLKRDLALVLTDLSAEMLELSRALNPECEHAQGDMRTLRLGRTFDAVRAHDAVSYLTTEADLAAAVRTAAAHLRPGGVALFSPDRTRECGAAGTDHGGVDAPDGRGLRFLEWVHDPDPDDTRYLVEYAFLLREADGTTRVERDRHELGLFPRATWLRLMEEAGLEARAAPFAPSAEAGLAGEVFVGVLRLPTAFRLHSSCQPHRLDPEPPGTARSLAPLVSDARELARAHKRGSGRTMSTSARTVVALVLVSVAPAAQRGAWECDDLDDPNACKLFDYALVLDGGTVTESSPDGSGPSAAELWNATPSGFGAAAPDWLGRARGLASLINCITAEETSESGAKKLEDLSIVSVFLQVEDSLDPEKMMLPTLEQSISKHYKLTAQRLEGCAFNDYSEGTLTSSIAVECIIGLADDPLVQEQVPLPPPSAEGEGEVESPLVSGGDIGIFIDKSRSSTTEDDFGIVSQSVGPEPLEPGDGGGFAFSHQSYEVTPYYEDAGSGTSAPIQAETITCEFTVDDLALSTSDVASSSDELVGEVTVGFDVGPFDIAWTFPAIQVPSLDPQTGSMALTYSPTFNAPLPDQNTPTEIAATSLTREWKAALSGNASADGDSLLDAWGDPVAGGFVKREETTVRTRVTLNAVGMGVVTMIKEQTH